MAFLKLSIMNFFLWILVWMSCLEKVNLIVFNSFVNSLQKVIIFISKIRRQFTLDALIEQLLVLLELGVIQGDKNLKRRLCWQYLNFLRVYFLQSLVESVNLAWYISFVLIHIRIVRIKNQVGNFSLLLLLSFDLLFQHILQLFVLVPRSQKIVPISIKLILGKRL